MEVSGLFALNEVHSFEIHADKERHIVRSVASQARDHTTTLATSLHYCVLLEPGG
jgi:hypothetical protein